MPETLTYRGGFPLSSAHWAGYPLGGGQGVRARGDGQVITRIPYYPGNDAGPPENRLPHSITT